MLRLAAARADRRAGLLALPRVQPVVGQVDAGIGQLGEVATGLGQVGQAVDVAPDDPRLLAVAVAAQTARQVVLAGAPSQRLLQLPAQFAGGQTALQLAAGGQLEEHLRIARGLLGDEVAGRQHPLQRRVAGGRPGRQVALPGLVEARLEGLPGVVDQRMQFRRLGNQGGKAHGLSLMAPRQPSAVL
ncbi:hypothetical protein D3C78_997160 [compost metagenome]